MLILYIGEDFDFFEDFFENQNVSFVVKHNAIEAIKTLKADTNIDVIISSYKLPGNNGVFLYEEIRKDKTLTQIPFILLIKAHNIQIYNKAFEIGIDDYYVINTTTSCQVISRALTLIKRNLNSQSSNYQNTSYQEYLKNTITNGTYKLPVIKRIFDISVASLILVVLSPILILIMLAIRIESKGKVYYIAKRVGRKTFDFYKLRSMRTGADKLLKDLAKSKNQYNAEMDEFDSEEEQSCERCSKLPKGQYCSPLKYGVNKKICDYMFNKNKAHSNSKKSSFIKIVDDPRVTKIGRFIRNTSIDELPQLINVIKGDMSLVGNRPLPVYEAELLTHDQMSKRFLAPAGITGLWQVELRGKGGDMSEEERMTLDNKYADYFIGGNYSFWFDIKILLRTIPALLQKSSV